jgi:hypothetical protein
MSHAANPNEDWRGVDVGQIRRLLAKSPAERAAEMIRVSNRLFRAQRRVIKSSDGRFRGV